MNPDLRYMRESLLINIALLKCQLFGTHTKTFKNKLAEQKDQFDLQPMHKLNRIENGALQNEEQLKRQFNKYLLGIYYVSVSKRV